MAAAVTQAAVTPAPLHQLVVVVVLAVAGSSRCTTRCTNSHILAQQNDIFIEPKWAKMVVDNKIAFRASKQRGEEMANWNRGAGGQNIKRGVRTGRIRTVRHLLKSAWCCKGFAISGFALATPNELVQDIKSWLHRPTRGTNISF
jgi:hypothetical protein